MYLPSWQGSQPTSQQGSQINRAFTYFSNLDKIDFRYFSTIFRRVQRYNWGRCRKDRNRLLDYWITEYSHGQGRPAISGWFLDTVKTRPGDLVMPDPFGHFLGWFWTILDQLDIFGPFCLLWPVYLEPSIWICLFGPVCLDLSLWTHMFWPIYLDPFFRPIYLCPSLWTPLIGPI